MTKHIRTFALALTLVAAAQPAFAQELATGPAAPPVRSTSPTQFISTNPIGLVLGVLSAEYERQVQPNASVAAGVSTFNLGGGTLFSMNAKYRYFLSEEALSGFSLAGTAGLVGGTFKDDCGGYEEYGCEEERHSAAFPSIGLELAYTFRLGAEKKYIIQPTLGAKRLFSKDLAEAGGPFSVALPTGGLSIGYVF